MSLKPPISCEEFCKMELVEQEKWWGKNGDRILGPQFKMMVSGRGGTKKSFFVMNLGLALSSKDKETFIGMDIANNKKVLYVNLEISEHSVQQRLRSMSINQSFPNMHIINSFDFNFENAQDRKNMFHYVSHYKYDVIIFDCMYQMHTLEENDEQDMKRVVKYLDIFIEHGIAVILVHHNCKNSNQERGSGLIFDWCDTVLGLKNDVLYFNKTRHAETPESISLHMDDNMWFETREESAGKVMNAKKINDDTIINILRREGVTKMKQKDLGKHIKDLGIASEWAIKKYKPEGKVLITTEDNQKIFSMGTFSD